MKIIATILLFFISTKFLVAQGDSSVNTAAQISNKYIAGINQKIENYNQRISKKTIKTLEKLSKWEDKIKALLHTTNPQLEVQLFGNNQLSFKTLLEQVKQGKSFAISNSILQNNYTSQLSAQLQYIQQEKAKLDEYKTTALQYKQQALQYKNKFDSIKTIADSGSSITSYIHNAKQQYINKATASLGQLDSLKNNVANTDAIDDFIKQRKKLLMQQAFEYAKNSKYFNKINKEAFYYKETLKNYKDIFENESKLEAEITKILMSNTHFLDFLNQTNTANNATSAVNGLQTISQVNQSIQQTASATNASVAGAGVGAGINPQDQLTNAIKDAQNELEKQKANLLKAGGSSSTDETPSFKPNMQKTKTFLQRLEFGNNFQFTNANQTIPAIADMALSIGYKLNDKSVVGVGSSYKMGMGTWQKIQFTTQGIGLKSYIDWKLIKTFFISGGYELNYLSSNATTVQNTWQPAGLIGISRKLNIKTKWASASKIQLLYNFLNNNNTPNASPFVFRVGYVFGAKTK